MSSKVTGDAQPDAGTGAGTDHTLPTEIVENMAVAETAAIADNAAAAENLAEAGAGAVTVAENAEPAAASAPDEPTEVLDVVGPADGGRAAGGGQAAKSGDAGGAGTGAERAGAGDAAGPAAGAGERPPEPLAELTEPAEPTELIAMTVPVELAEPVEMHRPRRRWVSALIALGFVVAAALIVGGAIAIVGSLTHGFKKPVVIHYKKSAIFSLKTGECINPNGQSATIVSCTGPHDAEVFATFALPESKWPGPSAVRAAASAGCSSRLTGYLNPQLAISLASTYIYPDSVAWQAGTRTVICEVHATSGQLTGSVRGATATAG